MCTKYMRRPVTPEGAKALARLREFEEKHKDFFKKVADSIAKGKRRSS